MSKSVKPVEKTKRTRKSSLKPFNFDVNGVTGTVFEKNAVSAVKSAVEEYIESSYTKDSVKEVTEVSLNITVSSKKSTE